MSHPVASEHGVALVANTLKTQTVACSTSTSVIVHASAITAGSPVYFKIGTAAEGMGADMSAAGEDNTWILHDNLRVREVVHLRSTLPGNLLTVRLISAGAATVSIEVLP